ncbi:MAG: zinc ribbon domain-containing protein [Thermoplasmata archaeon]
MYYSTYRDLTYAAIVVIALFVGAIAATISLGGAIVLAAVFLVFGFMAAVAHLYLVRSRLADYGGRFPMPNAGLGLLGVDILDDDYYDAQDDEPMDLPSNTLEGPRFTPHCPYCHAELTKPGVKFCNNCGKPLAVS